MQSLDRGDGENLEVGNRDCGCRNSDQSHCVHASTSAEEVRTKAMFARNGGVAAAQRAGAELELAASGHLESMGIT
jgi:hypothetical protein